MNTNEKVRVNLRELSYPAIVKAVDNTDGRESMIYLESPNWFIFAINLYKEQGRMWVEDNLNQEDYDFYEPTYLERMLMQNLLFYYNKEQAAFQKEDNERKIRQSKFWYRFTYAIAKWLMNKGYYKLSYWVNNDILPF